MNIFQLFFANSTKLTVKQQSAQKALHTIAITLLSSAIAESYILVTQKEPISMIVGTALIGSAVLSTLAIAIVPFLQEQGVNPQTITKIENDIEILSKIVNDIATTQQQQKEQ